jgi:hypothetical protein
VFVDRPHILTNGQKNGLRRGNRQIPGERIMLNGEGRLFGEQADSAAAVADRW